MVAVRGVDVVAMRVMSPMRGRGVRMCRVGAVVVRVMVAAMPRPVARMAPARTGQRDNRRDDAAQQR